MKHLKLYENTTKNKHNQPQVDDYVICEEILGDNIKNIKNNFININIGKILTNNDNQNYDVIYENIPKNLLTYFTQISDLTIDAAFISSSNNTQYGRFFKNLMSQYTRNMLRDEIIHFSPNKEDLLPYLYANKYNI